MDLRDITIRIEGYVNERIIEELEEVLSHFGEDGLYAIKGLKDRIKELKQE